MEQSTQIHNCSACGGNHGIMYHQLKAPVQINGEAYTHAGVCPVTLLDVYIQLIEE